jgi:hypothetical protein
MQFRDDRGESVKAFKDSGDELVAIVEGAIGNLHEDLPSGNPKPEAANPDGL